MKRVLIISSESEQYYYQPFLEEAAKNTDLDIVVFDTSKFPSNKKIATHLSSNGKISGHIDVDRYDKVCERYVSDTVEITSIDVAWYLRACSPVPSEMSTELDFTFSENESLAALNSLWLIVPWRWINSKTTVRMVENSKLYQQYIAASVGLSVPITLSSNDSDEVIGFAETESKLLLKAHSHTDIGLEEGMFMYSNIFEYNELISHTVAIQECPVFAQQYVPKRYEYRVMVMGRNILTCRIDSQASKKTCIDWRHYDFDNVSHDSVELPSEINKSILQFMQSIGLQYGAIDIIETPTGEFVFVEVNPSGQWGWIYELANLPIPQMVVKMLKEA